MYRVGLQRKLQRRLQRQTQGNIEKMAWDTRFLMYFQKNAWVDTETMIDLVKDFAEYDIYYECALPFTHEIKHIMLHF